MQKTEIKTIAEKNRIVNNIIRAFKTEKVFLLTGHEDPDTDCIAALASVGLLLRKLQREVILFLPGPVSEQFSYLLAICKYNGITVIYGKNERLDRVSAMVILDTPKPDMIAMNEDVRRIFETPSIRRIEIDHHLQSDAQYVGDDGYCLVSEASSACELIGYLCFKLVSRQSDGIGKEEFFTRNIVLSILTGIIGDSRMGKYLKSNKERWYYKKFSAIFDRLLVEKTHQNSHNLSSMEAVFDAIQGFSVQEKKCFDYFLSKKKDSKTKAIRFIALTQEESAALFAQYGVSLIVNVSKAAADTLAEESTKLGLVAFYDTPDRSGFIQFRLRRSAEFTSLDLRTVLSQLNIENGGGHPGAVGFRVPKDEAADLPAYTADLAAKIEALDY
jgi:nanoRNase/pAp phosphatase (c-di-AMP/oligoRNAs hydrolase)